MDHGACNVIYLDRRAREELVRRDTISMSLAAVANNAHDTQGYFRLGNPQAREVHSNIETILSTFNEGMQISSERRGLTDRDLDAYTRPETDEL